MRWLDSTAFLHFDFAFLFLVVFSVWVAPVFCECAFIFFLFVLSRDILLLWHFISQDTLLLSLSVFTVNAFDWSVRVTPNPYISTGLSSDNIFIWFVSFKSLYFTFRFVCCCLTFFFLSSSLYYVRWACFFWFVLFFSSCFEAESSIMNGVIRNTRNHILKWEKRFLVCCVKCNKSDLSYTSLCAIRICTGARTHIFGTLFFGSLYYAISVSLCRF